MPYLNGGSRQGRLAMSEDTTTQVDGDVACDEERAVVAVAAPSRSTRASSSPTKRTRRRAAKPAESKVSGSKRASDDGRFPHEVGALLVGVGALLTFLSLLTFSPDGGNWIGWAGHHFADALLYLFGVSSFLFVAVGVAWSASILRRDPLFARYGEGVGLGLIVLAMTALCHLATTETVFHHSSGGVIGLLAGAGLVELLGHVGSVLVLLTMLVAGGLLLTERSLGDVLDAGMRALEVGLQATRTRWADLTARGVTEPVLDGPSAPEVRELEADEPPGPGWTERLRAFAGSAGAGRQARLRTQTGSIVPSSLDDDAEDIALGDDPAWVMSLHEDDDASDDAPIGVTAKVKLACPALDPEARTKRTTAAPSRVAPESSETSVASRPPLMNEIGPVIVESEAQRNRKRAEELDRAQQQRLELGGTLEWEFPPLSFLNYTETQGEAVDREKLRDLASQLEKVLADFKVGGRVTGICPGPVVTLFEFEPDSGTKLSKISGLSDDIAMALKAHKVRIIAPIPGKGCVGIEVPNDTREVVYLKEILADGRFTNSRSKLTMALGKDIEGFPVVMDLAKSPHLLIAGTTGSGKSVAVNGMITSLLYNASPDEVKLILIDPKQLEFAIYEGIPHLLLPVVTDPAKAATALHWAVQEMERRYKLMAELKVRNLHNYNEKLAKLNETYGDYEAPESGPLDPMVEQLARIDEDGRPSHRHMYQLVVIVDEFADLMMVAGKEVEVSVARLAQKARASGIHCILATQRPSVDVITGLIKANFPTRISCRLMSGTDSRTVLDTIGAENLLGMGDMLYRPPGKSELTRVHGAFIDEEEIEKIVSFVNKQRAPEYDVTILEASADDAEFASDEPMDEKYDEAVQVVTEAGFASISMVQRRLGIGYNRSANIIEAMEREGIIGRAKGGSARREVLVAPI